MEFGAGVNAAAALKELMKVGPCATDASDVGQQMDVHGLGFPQEESTLSASGLKADRMTLLPSVYDAEYPSLALNVQSSVGGGNTDRDTHRSIGQGSREVVLAIGQNTVERMLCRGLDPMGVEPISTSIRSRTVMPTEDGIEQVTEIVPHLSEKDSIEGAAGTALNIAGSHHM